MASAWGGIAVRYAAVGALLGVVVLLFLVSPVLVLPVFAQAQCPGGCDDGNPCTDDLCDATLGCLHFNNSATCTDGNACTTNDVCHGGVCVGGNPAPGCSSCQATAILPPQGGTFVGATSGTGTLAASCGAGSPSPERVYEWTPPSSGLASISTCGPGTQFDTVVHVRTSSCTGPELTCNNNAPCAINGSSTLGSRVTPLVTGGETYYIVVDGTNGSSGTYALTVEPPASCGNGIREGSEACDGADANSCVTGECTAQCTCVAPPSGLPDLRPQIISPKFEYGSTVAQGDVAEGCAESTAGVDLLRFGIRVNNVGTADLTFGDPLCPNCSTNPLAACGNPNFFCSPAQGHNHPHYSNWARYELLDAENQAVVVGHKQGFCLRDSQCATPQYTCLNQGISVGCGDTYQGTLGCQYLDITDVPPGDYTLRVWVDPFDRIAELNEDNNVVSVPVTIPEPPPSACTAATTISAAGGVFTGSTSGVSTLTGTCGATGGAPEQVFRWTPSASGRATIETCGGTTNFNTVLYMRNGTCETGGQVMCNNDVTGCATGSGPNQGARITPTVTAGQTYFIVVDGSSGASGNFTLTVSPPAAPPPPSGDACDTPTVIPAAGGVFNGSTSGVSTLTGTCGATGGAPEKVFRWTPSASGRATIDTCGGTTNFDTVLYMRSGACETGTQVMCNNNITGCATGSGPNQGAQIRPIVTAGQTYFIVVDGSSGASGNFTLRVTSP